MHGSHPQLKISTPFLRAVEDNDDKALESSHKNLDSDIRIAILLAAWHGHENLLKGLVNHYENKHSGYHDKNLYGEALAEACQHNHWKIVEFLIARGANTSFVNHTPLIEALNSQSQECINLLLPHVNSKQMGGELIKAVVKSGHRCAFNLLLSHVPSLRCNAATLISWAVEYGRPSMVEAVIETGLKLELFQEKDFIRVVQLALEKNDDITLNALISYLREETLDETHNKLWDFDHRKKLKSAREEYKKNQHLRKQLSTLIDEKDLVRARKI